MFKCFYRKSAMIFEGNAMKISVCSREWRLWILYLSGSMGVFIANKVYCFYWSEGTGESYHLNSISEG
jgi:hypothetical protein